MNRSSEMPSRRLLVLASSFSYPPTNGYLLRQWAVLRSLAANGCELNVLSFGDQSELERHREEIARVCRNVELVPHPKISLSGRLDPWGRLAALAGPLPYGVARSRSTAMQARIRDYLEGNGIDALLCEETYLLIDCPARLPVPLIIDHHNVEHVMFERYARHAPDPARRLYAWLEARKVRRWEMRASSAASLLLVCSEQDRLAFARLCPAVPSVVAPNAIDTDAYAVAQSQDTATVLYTGGMDWYPNRDAVEYFAFQVLPHLRRTVPCPFKFRVAGRGPTPQFRDKFSGVSEIEFTGFVRDIRPEIARATVCVVPLRIGSGTRLKILEAAAMGKAIISTRLGAEGLDLVDGREIVLADTPAEFAAAVARLLNEPGSRQAFGRAARRCVEQHYSLPGLQHRLADAFAGVVPQPPTCGRAPLADRSGRNCCR